MLHPKGFANSLHFYRYVIVAIFHVKRFILQQFKCQYVNKFQIIQLKISSSCCWLLSETSKRRVTLQCDRGCFRRPSEAWPLLAFFVSYSAATFCGSGVGGGSLSCCHCSPSSVCQQMMRVHNLWCSFSYFCYYYIELYWKRPKQSLFQSKASLLLYSAAFPLSLTAVLFSWWPFKRKVGGCPKQKLP